MIKPMNRMMAALAVATLSFSGAALSAMPTFESVDVNQDGMLSPSEAGVLEGLDFGAADANADGALSREEYAQAAGKVQ